MSEDADYKYEESWKRFKQICGPNNYKEDNLKRMAMYKAQEEAYKRSENIDELNKRVLDLQFANTRIYGELQAQRKLCDVLIARLNKYNTPEDEQGYTAEDLKM